jgi:hypothetical protein
MIKMDEKNRSTETELISKQKAVDLVFHVIDEQYPDLSIQNTDIETSFTRIDANGDIIRRIGSNVNDNSVTTLLISSILSFIGNLIIQLRREAIDHAKDRPYNREEMRVQLMTAISITEFPHDASRREDLERFLNYFEAHSEKFK